jgi:hypothetical protein
VTAPKLDSHWRILSPSNYLGAPDLRGRDAKVKIASVSREDLNVEGQDDKEAKVVITFEGKKKPWVPCKTALQQIHMYLGTGFTADWIGKEIWLHPTSREWRQKTRDWTGKPIRNPKLNLVDDAVRVWPIEPPASTRREPQRAPSRGAPPSSRAPDPAPAAEPDEPYDGPPEDLEDPFS